MHPTPIIDGRMNSTAANARDAGLRLISKLNRWMVAGAVALAGLISVVAEKSFHGHTAAAVDPGSGSASGTVTATP